MNIEVKILLLYACQKNYHEISKKKSAKISYTTCLKRQVLYLGLVKVYSKQKQQVIWCQFQTMCAVWLYSITGELFPIFQCWKNWHYISLTFPEYRAMLHRLLVIAEVDCYQCIYSGTLSIQPLVYQISAFLKFVPLVPG